MSATYEVLEPGGHARLVGNVLDRIASASSNPASSAGSAAALLGDAETASWMERTTAADGAALIDAIYGNALRWNQMAKSIESGTWYGSQNSSTQRDGDKLTVTVLAESGGYRIAAVNTSNTTVGVKGHKYLVSYYVTCAKASGFGGDILNAGTMTFGASAAGVRSKISGIFEYPTTSYANPTSYIYLFPTEVFEVDETYTIDSPQLFDLTAMFGAGNEPATVAEFEALYPEPYYPYDAGSLLPVRMEGVETVGFNQWDEVWEVGAIDTNTGVDSADTGKIRSKDYIPIFAGMEYYAKSSAPIYLFFYDADKNYLGFHGSRKDNATFTPASLSNALSGGGSFASAAYMRFLCDTSTYNHDICINISDPSRNGTYESYWSSQRTIPATDLRSAGSVYDELRKSERITRVGAVDLGTLDWATYSSPDSHIWRTPTYQFPAPPKEKDGGATPVNAEIAKYTVKGYAPLSASDDKCFGIGNDRISIIDSDYSTAAAFKAAMDGVMLYYELATPTTTPIDPPLPLSYRTGAGGTERVMVASGTTSAPPIFATRYPLDPTDLAASIAPRESAVAEANHAVGDLVMLGWTLCKVTTAIARGESITIGTNVTRTSVAAELAALS